MTHVILSPGPKGLLRGGAKDLRESLEKEIEVDVKDSKFKS